MNLMTLHPLLTTHEVAELLQCEVPTVEEKLRAGELPGIKPGRSWMCPSEALLERLNELARANLEKAAPRAVGRTVKRRAPPELPEAG